MGQLRSKYRVFIWMTVVHFLLFLGTRMYRVVRAYSCPPPLRPWLALTLCPALVRRWRCWRTSRT